jgi:hypothetical protein
MKFWFIVLLLGSALGCASTEGLLRGYVISQHNQEAALKYLRPVLLSRGGAGRIYYSAACKTEDGESLPFPRVEVRPPSKETTDVVAVREIFENDKHVMVSEDRSGMIRVTIGQLVSALLQARIHSLTLKPHERYNAMLAIFAILNSKDGGAAMHQLGFDQPNIVFGGGIVLPEKGARLPHLPASMKDLTMDQALDAVARTFGGIVIYETCAERSGKRLVSLDFVQVANL